MGFLCGLAGALSGAVVGIAAVFFAVAASSDGNDFADAWGFMGLAPIGLVIGAVIGTVLALKLRRYMRGNWGIKSARRKTTVVLAGSIFAVPALAAAMIWGQQQLRKPPPDTQLLQNFERRQTTFNQLAQMTQADRNLKRVDYDWTDPSSPETIGVSPARVSIYRRLLDSVHCHRGFNAYQDHGTEFQYWGHGSAISDDEDKGYANLVVPPKQVLKTLDDCQPDEKNGVQAYRHIEGRWYLCYDYLPG